MSIPISVVLKKLRHNKGVKQQDVAKAIGISKSGYGYYEQGRSMPDLEMLLKLAKYFNVSVDCLLGLSKIDAPLSDVIDSECGSNTLLKKTSETLAEKFLDLLISSGEIKTKEDLTTGKALKILGKIFDQLKEDTK